MLGTIATAAPARAGIIMGTLVLGLPTSPGHATERLWVGPDGGYFADVKNWSPGGVPVGADFALFESGVGGVIDVAFFADTPAHATLTVRQGNVRFDLAGHTYSTLSALAGVVVGDTAFSAPCSLIMDGGVVSTDNAIVGLAADSTGTLTLLESTQWLATGQMNVGWFGEGSLVVWGPSAQSLLSTQGGTIGAQAGSDGTATVSGTFGQWTNTGDLTVGDAGVGALMMQSAGRVSTTGLVMIGDDAGADGDVTVTGFGSMLSSGGDIVVGNDGAASLLVEAGGTVSSSSNGSVGTTQASSASAVVTGPGSSWHCDGFVAIGAGTAVIEDGGALTTGINVIVFGIPAGSLYGDGLVETVRMFNHGFVGPGRTSGDTTGTLTVDADYEQGGDGTLGIELAGTGAGQHDVLDVTGDAELAGTLVAVYVDGFLPAVGDSFVVLTAGDVIGQFDDLDAAPIPNATYCLAYGPTTVELRVISAADLDCDFQVGVTDLLTLLGAWGTGIADITGDGTTDVLDLLALLAAWGV